MFKFQVFNGREFFTVENGTFATRAEAEEFGRTNTAGLRTCRIVGSESLFTPIELATTVSAEEYRRDQEFYEEAYAEFDAETAYERHLEDAGYEEARLQEDMEARMGILSFSQARELAENGSYTATEDQLAAQWDASQAGQRA